MGKPPESPIDLTWRSWKYVVRKTVREFMDDECTDLAAALTYYAVLSFVPALVALLSVVGLVDKTEETVRTILGILSDVGADPVVAVLEPTLRELARARQSAGPAFVIGLAGALWSGSGYVGSFGRAMNRIYEVPEGRPLWKRRAWMLLVTLVALVLSAVIVLALVLSGPVAEAVGRALGLGTTVVTVWSVVQWPVTLLAMSLIIAMLYHATPNVRRPKFLWVSVGAVFAVVVWLIGSWAFGFYVSHFASYNRTYGTLGGVVVLLLWLWITNLALLFGAQLDAELERARELQAGLPAEERIQLEPRDTTGIEKDKERDKEDIELAREIREQEE